MCQARGRALGLQQECDPDLLGPLMALSAKAIWETR